jgi:hypothetical protein
MRDLVANHAVLARSRETRRPPGVHEIGSDFELVDDQLLGATTSTRLPWERADDNTITAGDITAEDITYVKSGRQALALVEKTLRSQGHTRLHVPSYLCDSMIVPFQKTGWALRTLPVDRDLMVNPADALSQVTSGAFLHAPYFGRQDSSAMLAALETLRKRGVVVIVDETHRLFSGPSQVADIRVASLRKLLPVYDGGYVAGLSELLASNASSSVALSSSGSEIAELRHIAQIAKSIALTTGDNDSSHLAIFAKADQATKVHAQPALISSKSLSLLHRLDFRLIKQTRQANSIALSRALGQSPCFRIINPPATDLLPSHLVLETDEAARLRKFLVGHQIYCPIHWPESQLLPRTQEWPTRYLSLPTDHRYGEQDMLRIAAKVHAFFAKQIGLTVI